MNNSNNYIFHRYKIFTVAILAQVPSSLPHPFLLPPPASSGCVSAEPDDGFPFLLRGHAQDAGLFAEGGEKPSL